MRKPCTSELPDDATRRPVASETPALAAAAAVPWKSPVGAAAALTQRTTARSSALLAAGLALATAVVAGTLWPIATDPATAPARRQLTTVPTAAPTTDRASGDATAPTEAPVVVDHSRQLELPDGSFVAALNGAVEAAPLQQYWGPFDWSPITGVVRAGPIDWYQHADGSFSTTQMVWRSDLGRMAAMTRVAHPGPAPAAAR